MTTILTILLLTFRLTALGQSCDTINGKVINYIDTKGLRQGYWEFTRKNILVSGLNGLGSKEGCRYVEKAAYLPIAKVHYRDNKKIGTLEYCTDNDYLISVDKQITYYSNRNKKVENGIEQYSIEINNETSEVSGYFYHEIASIKINYNDQNCKLHLSDDNELMNFHFPNLQMLEYELLSLRMGFYDREIKRMKKER